MSQIVLGIMHKKIIKVIITATKRLYLISDFKFFYFPIEINTIYAHISPLKFFLYFSNNLRLFSRAFFLNLFIAGVGLF